MQYESAKFFFRQILVFTMVTSNSPNFLPAKFFARQIFPLYGAMQMVCNSHIESSLLVLPTSICQVNFLSFR